MVENSSVGKNSLSGTYYIAVIGFALCWAVTYITAYSFVLVPPSEFSGFERDISRTCYLGGVVLAEFIIYLLSKKLAPRRFRPFLAIGIYLVMLICIMVFVISPDMSPKTILLIIAMLAIGLWQGVFHVLWLEQIFYLPAKDTVKTIYLSIILGAALFVITVLIPSTASIYALLLLAMLSLVVFLLTIRLSPKRNPSGKYVTRKTAKDLYRSNAILLVYGAVFGVGIYACMTEGVPSYISYPLTGLALAGGVAFLYFMYVLRQRFFTFDELSIALLPLTAVALLLLSFAPESMAWIVYLVVLLLLTMFDSAAFLHIFDITRAFSLSPLQSISRTRGILQFGMFVACCLNLVIAHFFSAAGNSSFYMSLILIFFLFVMIAISGTVTALPRRTPTPNETLYEKTEEEDKTSHKCRIIATEYNLSKREYEVLDLLVRGYQAQVIAEKLFISKNTVKSHIRHIYQKMGVSSKQEVLDIRDAVDTEDSDDA